jgi:hypothetical protein
MKPSAEGSGGIGRGCGPVAVRPPVGEGAVAGVGAGARGVYEYVVGDEVLAGVLTVGAAGVSSGPVVGTWSVRG